MDLAKLEEVISLAVGNSSSKTQATAMLDSLRIAPDRWRLGLQLWQNDSMSDVAKIFGLSLIRDYLSRGPCADQSAADLQQDQGIRRTIRETVINWCRTSISSGSQIPHFILSSVVTIITLGIKFEYPAQWPTAFDEVLPMAETGPYGVDLVVRILSELEVEVVMFSEQRTEEEKRSNTAVKDAMRASPVIAQIVALLCRNTVACHQAGFPELAERCLRCLSELISWIELQLVLQSALPTLYTALTLPQFTAAACSCLYEMLKKGMDSVNKIRMIHSIELVPALLTVPASLQGQPTSHSQTSLRSICEPWVEEYGLVVDMLFLELLSCWGRFEDTLQAQVTGRVVDNSVECQQVAPLCAELLHTTMPLILEIFSHESTNVCATVVPALNKLMSALRSQLLLSPGIVNGYSSPSLLFPARYFLAAEYVPLLLRAVYKQMQYEEGFAFDLGDDDDVAVIEAKKDVRKLFVNCCRLLPDACLDLVRGAFSSLSQPLSRCPFNQLEAALRLAFAFSECGAQYPKLISEGAYPELLCAIHTTDISNHPHPQVLLWYFDLSVTRCLQQTIPLAPSIGQTMAGQRGILHTDPVIRRKAAQCLLRLIDQLGQNAIALIPLTGVFADLILNASSRPGLTEQAEMHLLEASSLLTALTTNPEAGQSQGELLQKIIAVLAHQVQGALSAVAMHMNAATDPMAGMQSCPDHLLETLGHKLVSISALGKCHKFKTHARTSVLFAPPAGLVTQLLSVAGFSSLIRQKVCTFLNHMVHILGLPITELLCHPDCFARLIDCCDESDTDLAVQILASVMVEHRELAVPLLDVVLPKVLLRYHALFSEIDAGGENGVQWDTDRTNLQKQYLVFIYNIAQNGCQGALTSPHVGALLDGVFHYILEGLRGGPGTSGGSRNGSSGVPLRKYAVQILTSLATPWSRPPTSLQLTEAYQSFVLHQALPCILSDLTDGTTLSLSDAATHNLLELVGALIWTTASFHGPQLCAEGLSSSLQSGMKHQWSSETVQALCQAVGQPGQQVNTFKDSFKRFIRSFAQR